MADNDPADLRFTAARLFVALLDQGDMAGVVVFSTGSQPLGSGLTTINSPADRLQLARAIQPVAAAGWTDAKAAFGDLQAMLSRANLGGRKAVVVFMTDGTPEVAGAPAGYEDEVLAVAQGLGLPVLSIALTPVAQTPFLSRLAALTGGTVVPANDAADLLDAYLEVFGQIKDRAVVGSGQTTAPGVAELPLDPALAPYVESASLIVAKPVAAAAQLLGPDGSALDPDLPPAGVAFIEDPRFLAATVERPAGGPWGFALQGEGVAQARAILHCRLRVEAVAPQRFHEAGQPMPIVVRLFEEEADGERVKIIGEASYSAEITRPDGRRESLDQFYDDGTHGDARAGDGDYSRLYVNADQPGAYAIVVQARKGTVPVQRTIQVEAVEFPQLVVDEPTAGNYDIGQQLPLRVHLLGGTPPLLDAGDIVAHISAQSGAAEEVRLVAQGGAYTGSFIPREAGRYAVEFEARDAAYKGLPYTRTATAKGEIVVMPGVSIAGDPIDLGQVELATAREGVTITIAASSTSNQPEPLQARLEGLAGLELADTGDYSLPPHSLGPLTVHLRATSETGAGRLDGWMLFSAAPGVDLVGGAVPIRGELYQPTLRLSPALLDLGMPARCPGWYGRLPVTFACTSLQTETVRLGVWGQDGLRVEPAVVQVAPGEKGARVTLEFLPRQVPPPGTYTVSLTLQGRAGLEIVPGVSVPVTFRVPSTFRRCRIQLGGGAVLLMIIILAAVRVARDVIDSRRPPLVTGTLWYWPKESPSARTAVDLTGLRRTRVTIGRGGGCDVSIADPTLADEHAVLDAQKATDGVRVMLVPVGDVRVKYRALLGPSELRHGDALTMGEHEFRYLSDEGI